MTKNEFLKLFKECIEDGSLSIDVDIEEECDTDYGDCWYKGYITIKINGEVVERKYSL